MPLPSPRILLGDYLAGVEPHFTIQVTEETSFGSWAKPKTNVLIFNDHNLDGTLSFGNGPIAGAPEGQPVQLLFWGDWWKTGGAAKCNLIIERTKALFASNYFSELKQYGIPRAPVLRGSLIVTDPGPPGSVDDSKKLMKQTLELIDDLIDDDVFPDPDDGSRIVFVVLLPDSTAFNISGVAGAHSSDYDVSFLWDVDNFWAGWIRPGLPVDPVTGSASSTMNVMSHEIVETLTDPEFDGWRTSSSDRGRFEVSDAAFSVSPAMVAQTAFVNGVHAQAYWSTTHNATVLPLDNDYRSRLESRTTEISRRVVGSGRFHPTDADNRFCRPEFPECCMADREYEWRTYSVDEVAHIDALTQRYRRTSLTWTINGNVYRGEAAFPVTVRAADYSGKELRESERTVVLRCRLTPNGLEINSSGFNFALDIGCQVRELDITGNLNPAVDGLVSVPHVTVSFNGAELLYDDEYLRQRTACLAAMIRRYALQYEPGRDITPEEGINWKQIILDTPAYVRPAQYAALQWIAKATHSAQQLSRIDQTPLAMPTMAEALSLAGNIDLRELKAAIRPRRDKFENKRPDPSARCVAVS